MENFRSSSLVSRSVSKKKKKGRRRRRKQHRYRISRGGTVIPATKIAQVDPSPPSSSRASSALFTKDSRAEGKGEATRFHWRNEDEECAVPAEERWEGRKVFPPSPSPVSLVSRADLFRRARFQFSRTPVRRRWFAARAPSAFTHISSVRTEMVSRDL